MFQHVFRNAFVPMAQYIPTSFLNTVVGSIYIESLYAIPGMGGLLVDVVKKQDNNMVQGIVLVLRRRRRPDLRRFADGAA